jgi:hypothetical protein
MFVFSRDSCESTGSEQRKTEENNMSRNKMQVKVVGEPYAKGAMLVGTNLSVQARGWDSETGEPTTEWFDVRARSVSFNADAFGFATANVEMYVHEVENLTATLKDVTVVAQLEPLVPEAAARHYELASQAPDFDEAQYLLSLREACGKS